MTKKPEIFEILKALYLDELVFVADRLSDDREKWKYDKRSKSSVRNAICSNVDEASLTRTFKKSLGQKMFAGGFFPEVVQFKKIVLGPLGFEKSIELRKRYDSDAITNIFNRYVRGNSILERVAKAMREKLPKGIVETIAEVKERHYKSTIVQLVLTFLSDKEICCLVNNLLANREIDLEVTGLYEDIGFPWIITRYGLAIAPREEPIENLATLIGDYYDEEDIEPELRPYSGDFRTRLLEYCIMENPGTILQHLFGLPELRQIAGELGFVSSKIAERAETTSIVLLGLGFNVPPNLVGISSYTKSIQKFRKDLAETREVGVRSGIMSQIFTTTERVLRDIAYFYISFLWKKRLEHMAKTIEVEKPDLNPKQVKAKSLDILIRRRFGIKKSFERLGFGDFISLMRTVSLTISKSEVFKVRLLRSFGRNHILQRRDFRVLDSVSPYRSSFAHTKDYPGDEKCDEIAGSIEELLKDIQTKEIYPLVVRISREVRDEYGKSFAECIDENGEKWLLYAEEYLDTSEPYFLHSKTPSIAVNPIVIEKIF